MPKKTTPFTSTVPDNKNCLSDPVFKSENLGVSVPSFEKI